MKCDACGGESSHGRSHEWMAGRVLSERTLGVEGAHYKVEQSYGDFARVTAFLCEPCFARARRRRLLTCLALLVIVAAVAPGWLYLVDYLTRPGGYRGELPDVVQIILALVTIIVGLAPLVLAGELARGLWFWLGKNPKEVGMLLKSHAEKKGGGRPVLWTLAAFEELRQKDRELRKRRQTSPFD